MTDEFLWIEGIPFPTVYYSQEIIREVRDRFVVRDEDTIIVTYPKSGMYNVFLFWSRIEARILCLLSNYFSFGCM